MLFLFFIIEPGKFWLSCISGEESKSRREYLTTKKQQLRTKVLLASSSHWNLCCALECLGLKARAHLELKSDINFLITREASILC